MIIIKNWFPCNKYFQGSDTSTGHGSRTWRRNSKVQDSRSYAQNTSFAQVISKGISDQEIPEESKINPRKMMIEYMEGQVGEDILHISSFAVRRSFMLKIKVRKELNFLLATEGVSSE